MVKQYKVDEVQDIIETLQGRKNIILTSYSGIKVQELSKLRKSLKEKGAQYKVVKNTLLRRALHETGFANIDEHLKGPIGVAFAGEDAGAVAKVLKEFKAEQENFRYFIGVFDNVVYDENAVKKVADLPSREVLLAQTMMLINGPASGIAIGMNQIMASLARGIKAVAEKNQ